MRARRRAAPPIRPNLSFSVHTGVNILLHPTDTKAKRAESFRVPVVLLGRIERTERR